MRGTNSYPSRTYPGTPAGVEVLPPVGGIGKAALPSRIIYSPPPAPVATAGGAFGPEPRVGSEGARRGPAIVAPPHSPGEQDIGWVDNTYAHGTIAWSRPFFPNVAGFLGFTAPTQSPSWSANSSAEPDRPSSPVPVSSKRIDNFTLREQYGSDRQLFPTWGTRRPYSGTHQQLRRSAVQAKTKNPYQDRLTTYGLAGSFGQTTQQLPTAPVNKALGSTGAIASPYGSY